MNPGKYENNSLKIYKMVFIAKLKSRYFVSLLHQNKNRPFPKSLPF